MPNSTTNKLPPTPDDRCGTYAGKRAHDRRKEELCEACYEARKTYNREYQQKNKERVYAQHNAWAAEHREERRAYYQEYQRHNKEKISEKGKRWYAQHEGYSRARARRRRAQALENGAEPYTEQQVLGAYGTDCHICKEPIDMKAPRRAGLEGWQKSLHIDHLTPIFQGGPDTLENVRPAHAVCNFSKGWKMPEVENGIGKAG